jgi:hypothetical protein
MWLNIKQTEASVMIGHASLFSQVLSLIDRHHFAGMVKALNAEKHAKGFTCWGQFVAMLFCQLAKAKSLREIVQGLRCCEGKLKHLGIEEHPKRSTLSYANEHRPWELYRSVFYALLERCMAIAPSKKFRFKNKLLSMDATVIELCATMFDWAKFRQAKGALKVHLLLDHDGYLPVFAHITEGREHELLTIRHLHFARGTIVAFDRAYIDYKLFEQWSVNGVYFVTRMKQNANWWTDTRQVVPKGSTVVKDEIGEFHIGHAGRKIVHSYRKVTVWLEDKKEELVLLTNNFKLAARTIAAIYKERWQIELFFKALKQNLRVKTFVGTSANAVHIQIWTALIAILLLKYLQFKATMAWALSNLAALLHWNLFTYRDLWQWINRPTDGPTEQPDAEQLCMVLDSI